MSMETILGASWYTVEQAARALELPVEVVQRFFDRVMEDKRTAVSYYHDPTQPAISGYTLMQLAGQRQPSSFLPTTRRRRR